jgi:hypothetical protein
MIGIGMRVSLAAVMAAAVLAGCEDKGPAPGGSANPAPARPSAAADTGTAATTVATKKAPPAKVFDCGGKEQKPCPMQGWMKRVMAPASAGDDGAALMKALGYVAEHAPPGYADWTSIAHAGAARAHAGDVDGAKASCKKCHDAYKENYKATMRDRPF